MKNLTKLIKKIFFLIIVFFITLNNYAQLTVSIGNDTTFCGSNIENGIELASRLTVSGGTNLILILGQWNVSDLTIFRIHIFMQEII